MKKKSEITNHQLLEAIQGIDKKVDKNRQLIEGNNQLIKENRKSIEGNKYLINQNKGELLSAMNQFSIEVENRFDSVESRLNRLEFNQEDILSKLDNVAYKTDIIRLDKRISVLENK